MLRIVATAWLACGWAWVFAAAPLVSAPPDRVVVPGEFATLVFRVESQNAGSARVTAVAPPGWRVVRTTESIDMRPGVATPIVVTVGVPALAAAEAVEYVQVRIEANGSVVDASVGLEVAARYAFTLETPREVVLDGDPVRASVANTGNVLADIVVDVRRAGSSVASQRVSVAPGQAATLTFALDLEGSYVVMATGADGTLERRSVDVISLGGPTRTPFALDGTLEVRGTGLARPQVVARVAGPLSDLLRVDARIDAMALEGSRLEVRSPALDVHLGSGWRDAFGVGLTSDSIAAATLRGPDWTAGALLAGPTTAPTTFAVLAMHAWSDGDAAGAIGWQRGAPLLALRASVARDDLRAASALRLAEGTYAWSLRTAVGHQAGTTSLDLAGAAFGSERASATFDLQHLDGTGVTRVYAQGRVPLFDVGAWDGRVGLATTFERDEATSVHLSAHAGNRERQLRVEYRARRPDDWRFSAGAGARFDPAGSRLVSEVRLVRTPRPRYTSYEVRAELSPQTLAWDAWFTTQHQRVVGPWAWSVGGAWNAGGQRLTGTAALEYGSGPWTVAVTAGARYDYAAATDPWAVDVALRARYQWSWAVPDTITLLTGGREAGVVAGQVESSGEPVAGVRIDVGPYRLVTDDAGRFEIVLPPGAYEFRLDTASLPLVARLLDAPMQAVAVSVGQRIDLSWQAVRTTVLEGAVVELLDPGAVVDAPPRGVPARLVVTDAEGLQRVVSTGSDGLGGFNRSSQRALGGAYGTSEGLGSDGDGPAADAFTGPSWSGS